MAYTNFDTKEINAKVVYFGAQGSGRTTNLRAIYSALSDEVKSGKVELSPLEERTPFFDFVPLSLGQVNDFHLKMHLFTVPDNKLFSDSVSTILKGMDGYVFVADSDPINLFKTVDAYKESLGYMAKEGVDAERIPSVIQYNKRDLDSRADIEILRSEFNPLKVPEQEAISAKGIGTLETFEAISKLIIDKLAFQVGTS